MKPQDTDRQDSYRQEQESRFEETFLSPSGGEAPSPRTAPEEAALPRLRRFEYPGMSEEHRQYLAVFTSSSALAASAPPGPVPADLASLRVDYRSRLNDAQLQAALWEGGPLLVIAGAGTGKTWTICCRAAYLIERGVPPGEILLLTFTRKAASEMIGRASMLLDDAEAAGRISGGTFHGFAHRMIKRYADIIGVDRNFTILDETDARDVIVLIRDELKLRRRDNVPVPKGQVIQGILGTSRSCELTVKEVITRDHEHLSVYIPDLEVIQRLYLKYKQAHRYMDYDDLLEVLYEKLQNNSRFRQLVHRQFTHIIVDEYQDTNTVQGRLVEALAGERRQVMVVGDDAQSIYGFRGAKSENILNFPRIFPASGIIRIEKNYRSTPEILAYANDVTGAMTFAYPKQLASVRPGGAKPEVHRCFSQQEEASWICDAVENLQQQGSALADIAAVYRSNHLSGHLQAELLKRRIPFIVYGGLKFVERRHVKDMLAFVRISLNTLDAAAWHRVLRMISGIGQVRSGMIIRTVAENGGVFSAQKFRGHPFFSAMEELEGVIRYLQDDRLSLQQRLLRLKAYYLPVMRQHCEDYARRIPDLDVLASLAESSSSMEEFFSDLALDPPSASFQDYPTEKHDGDADSLVLSTVHSAKGLEWRYVFVISMLDGVFPDIRSLHDFSSLEEERRLFYVACTRARDGLYLSFPSYIQTHQYFALPSRFLSEQDREHFSFYIGRREHPVKFV